VTISSSLPLPFAHVGGSTTAGRWDEARNVLCVRLDHIGDVLMSTPAMVALKAGHRNRRVTLLTSPAGAAIAPLIPVIDDTIVYDAPWMKATASRADSGPEYAVVERLRAEHFDAAVIFTVYSQNPMPPAFLCYLADIPLRLAHCRENPYQMLTDWIPESEPERGIRHEVRRQLDLVAAVGCHTADERMSLRVPETAVARADALLTEAEIDPSRTWVIVHPGATAPSRRYLPEGFAAVARRLAIESGWQVLFTGTQAESELIAGIRSMAGVPTHALVGRASLAEFAALIARAPLLLANNSGPAHIAAALGTPVVDLYALTNPQHTPWGVAHRVLSHDVPCKYCYKSICPMGHHDCLRRVAPDTVFEAIHELYRETTGAPAFAEAARA
jgi:lipopolysaccharide heptosyltransferase II